MRHEQVRVHIPRKLAPDQNGSQFAWWSRRGDISSRNCALCRCTSSFLVPDTGFRLLELVHGIARV